MAPSLATPKMLHLGNQKKRVALPSLTPTTKANCYGIINGSLLRNKETNLEDFDAPTEWMIDWIWEKRATKQDMSSMRYVEVKNIETYEVNVLIIEER